MQVQSQSLSKSARGFQRAAPAATGVAGAAAMIPPKDRLESTPTSLTLIPKSLQSRMSTVASEVKVRKLDIESTRRHQSDLALEISGRALTGYDGALLKIAVQEKKGQSELVGTNGIRWLLPVKPWSEFSEIGYIVAMPDGTKLTVSPESLNIGLSLDRSNESGDSIYAGFTNQLDTDGSQELRILTASTEMHQHIVALDAHEKGGVQFSVQNNSYPGATGRGITIRRAGERGISSVTQSSYGTMGDTMDFSFESHSLTAMALQESASRIERDHPFLPPSPPET